MKPVLYGIVDGNWYLHRMYHASRGRAPAIAVVRLILKDASSLGITHLGVAFDSKTNFRKSITTTYKANRSLSPVIELLKLTKEELKRQGIKVYHKKEYEADDVIASFCQLYTPCVVFSADKDLFQCAGLGISFYNSISGKLETSGANRGITLDYQILVGDKTDNVEGELQNKPALARKLLGIFGNYKDAAHSLNLNMKKIEKTRKLVTLVTSLKLGKPTLVKTKNKGLF